MADIVVGIDLAITGKHVAIIRRANSAESSKPIRFTHNVGEMDGVWTSIARTRSSSQDVIRVLMEPTGMSWLPVSSYFAKRGCEVIRVTGQRVHALRSYLSKHLKTDPVDAEILARMPEYGGAGLQKVWLPNPAELALRRCARQRARFAGQLAATERRIQALVHWSHPALEAALDNNRTSNIARAVLTEYFNPYRMRRLGARRLMLFLAKHRAGAHRKAVTPNDERVQQLLAAAEYAISFYGKSSVDFDAVQHEVKRELELYNLYRAHNHGLEEEVAELSAHTGLKHLIETIPGVGPRLSGSLLGFIGPIDRFRNLAAFRSYCGIIPRVSQSGIGSSRSRMTKAGPAELKRSLYIAADVARKFDPQLAQIYRNDRTVKSHHHTQAVCAVATHLAARIYRVLRDKAPYILRDANGAIVDKFAAKKLMAAIAPAASDGICATEQGETAAAFEATRERPSAATIPNNRRLKKVACQDKKQRIKRVDKC